MSLERGKRIHRYQWDTLPISKDVLDRVDAIAVHEGQSLVAKSFKFQWNPDGEEIDGKEISEDDDVSLSLHEAPQSSRLLVIDEETETREQSDDDIDVEEEMRIEDDDIEENNVADDIEENDDADDEVPTVDQEGEVTLHEDQGAEEPITVEDEAIENATMNTDNEEREDQRIEIEERESSSNRPRRNVAGRGIDRLVMTFDGKMYTHSRDRQFLTLNEKRKVKKRLKLQYKNKPMKKLKGLKRKMSVKLNDPYRSMVGVMMSQISKESKNAQVSVKEGIKRFGDKAIQALVVELTQLDDKNTFTPLMVNELNNDEKRMSLNLLALIKQKRCGKVKGRVVADGRKQRKFVPREEATSPTIKLESLLMSLVIDAKEKRSVATADIVGAYLLADMKDKVIVKLTGESVRIMCKNNSKYNDFVTKEKNKEIIYLKLDKALYGCVQSALLWYHTFTSELMTQGFKLNRYDPCVANKMIDGNQCTICWYVDDTKVSHKSEKVVTDVLNTLESKFGKMSIKRGKNHTFVGMDITFLDNGTVKIMMDDYIRECIDVYGEHKLKDRKTPGGSDLFEVDDKAEGLNKENSDTFHHIVAKLLFVAKRARLDIEPTISFLCTRVSKSTTQDWIKLGRLLGYLKMTINLPRIIGADRLDIISCWADASYAVHPDMKGHTGGTTSLGVGVTHTMCSKQKLNTKSSTESEIVGASKYITFLVWLAGFMKDQGVDVSKKILFQDNMSAMQIEKNDSFSAGSKSRHLKIRFFFIKDILERENIVIEHCPTNIMIADFFTKPLQGKQFKKMRDIIMGLTPITMEERVRENSISLDKSIDEECKQTGQSTDEINNKTCTEQSTDGIGNEPRTEQGTDETLMSKVQGTDLSTKNPLVTTKYNTEQSTDKILVSRYREVEAKNCNDSMCRE